jgi:hypothetical protein
MSWAERLLRIATGDWKPEVIGHLQAFQRGTTALAESLAAAAVQAPNAGAESELRELIGLANELSAALARAVQERASTVTALPSAVLNGAARNHWARLVNALEACRELRAQVLRNTPRLLELDPSLAEPLRDLAAGLHAQLLGLRALIARADPQALD